MLTDAEIQREAIESMRMLETATGQPATAFVWLHGSSYRQSSRHDEAIQRTGYRHQFANTMVHRGN